MKFTALWSIQFVGTAIMR